MLATVPERIALLCLGLGLIGLIAGCNPRELTVSATDRVYVPSPKELAEQEGRKVAEAKAESPEARGRPGPETVPSLAPREEEKGPMAAGGRAPLEEVRVAEPPIQPPGVPQPPEPAPGTPPSGESLPLVAQAMPDRDAGSPVPPASEVGSSPGVALDDVFFDYDRFMIRGDAKPVLQANSAALKSEKNLRIVIEGHCDERGTSEYNLVLGEKRARAVRQYLQDLGVEPSRVQITSLGKERPFCTEHNPTCWQKNRRAHFVMQ